MRLSNYLKKVNKSLTGNNEDIHLSLLNLDDCFAYLKQLGIKEIKVNEEQMGLIVRFVVANTGQTEYGSQALKNGVVDKYFGIKLILE